MATINEITDKNKLAHKTIKIGKIPVDIKGYITADTFAEITNTIANSCFDEEGKYRPEFKEIARRYVVLKYLTDIDLGEISSTEIFKITQNSWYETIEIEINKLSIWCEIDRAVDEIINYKLLTRKSTFDDLCETLSKFAEKMGDTKALDSIAEKLNNLDDKTVVETIIEK